MIAYLLYIPEAQLLSTFCVTRFSLLTAAKFADHIDQHVLVLWKR